MNKKELAAQVAEQTGMTVVGALKAIDAVFQTIRKSLEENESTVIVGFGSFSVMTRAQRRGVNPVTKEVILIPSRRAVKFTASKIIEVK